MIFNFMIKSRHHDQIEKKSDSIMNSQWSLDENSENTKRLLHRSDSKKGLMIFLDVDDFSEVRKSTSWKSKWVAVHSKFLLKHDNKKRSIKKKIYVLFHDFRNSSIDCKKWYIFYWDD